MVEEYNITMVLIVKTQLHLQTNMKAIIIMVDFIEKHSEVVDRLTLNFCTPKSSSNISNETYKIKCKDIFLTT